MAASDTDHITTGPRIPIGSVLWGLLSIVFIVITSALIFQLRPAPDSRVDNVLARLDALESKPIIQLSKDPQMYSMINNLPHISEAITAVIYSRRLNMRLESLKSMLENHKKKTTFHLNLMVTSPEDAKRIAITRAEVAINVKQIKEMVKDDLGIDINLEQHPRFDLNHHFRPAPQGILPELEEDYIRNSEQYENASRTIEELKWQYQNAWGKYETIINNWK